MFQNNFSNPYAALMGYNPQPQQNMFAPQVEPAQNRRCALYARSEELTLINLCHSLSKEFANSK